MITQAQHRMERVRTHESGAEEWACPTCGRRLLLHAHPTLEAAVLTAGDGQAAHYGGMGAPTVAPAPHAAEPVLGGGGGGDGEMPHEMLRPWLNALRAIQDEGLVL